MKPVIALSAFMMDHIASDNARRTLMTDKMIYYAIGDTVRMTEMCARIAEDKRMFPLLVKIEEERPNSVKTKKEK